MKKILTILAAALALTGPALAQTASTAQMKFYPLINGYNVHVPTNVTVGLGVTNVEFTTFKGQNWYSYNGPTNGAWMGTAASTNQSAFPNVDAFQVVTVRGDANGDINANASVAIMLGNTNWIPVVQQSNFVSFAANVISTNWLLGYPTGGNVPQFTVGTNTFTVYTNAATNVVTVTLYRAPALAPGGENAPAGSARVPMWETTTAFSFAVTPNGITPVCLITNLPSGWLQGARYVYATASCPPNTANNGNGILINQVGILQPQP